MTELERAISYVRKHNRKIYITANSFVSEKDLIPYKKYINDVAELKPDAFIVSDPGALYSLIKTPLLIPIHLSTQANTLNSDAVKFWAELGIKRINLGRELSIDEIREIKQNVSGMELEMFIHGALCLSFSGRCFLSDFLTNRSANKGICTHPCRWNYGVIEEKRGRHAFEVEETIKGYSSFFSPYDVMTLEFLSDILALKVDSLKIEGRMKSAFYTGMAVHIYRKNIERIIQGKEWDRNDIKRLLYITKRGYGHGFLKRNYIDDISNLVYNKTDDTENSFIGIIDNIEKINSSIYIRLKLKNSIKSGNECEIISPKGEYRITVDDMLDMTYNTLKRANPNSVVYIKVDNLNVHINDIIYRI